MTPHDPSEYFAVDDCGCPVRWADQDLVDDEETVTDHTADCRERPDTPEFRIYPIFPDHTQGTTGEKEAASDEHSAFAQVTCERCGLPILLADDWVVDGTGTTADGLSYCPPDPDHDGYLTSHHPQW